MESRVYEDVVEDAASDASAVATSAAKPEAEAEVSESELVPKVAAAIAEGVKILKMRGKADAGGGGGGAAGDLAVAMKHYGTKPGHFETSKIHFPTSERCERTSERTSEWPSTYIWILVCSRPQWSDR